MKKIIFSFLALFSATPAIAAPSLLEVLKAREGIYVLSANDASNPCRSGDLKIGSVSRLRVEIIENSGEFYRAGDIVVRQEQYFGNIQKWGTLFDRADFGPVNGGTRRFFSLPLVVSHSSTYSHRESRLTHSVTMTTVTGGSEAVQEIEFLDGEKKFVYNYKIHERNALGYTTSTENYGRCEFTRQ